MGALEQTSRLYDLDVFALVSWDQVVNTDGTMFSILYWTIVGGYVTPASENDAVRRRHSRRCLAVRGRFLLAGRLGFRPEGRIGWRILAASVLPPNPSRPRARLDERPRGVSRPVPRSAPGSRASRRSELCAATGRTSPSPTGARPPRPLPNRGRRGTALWCSRSWDW